MGVAVILACGGEPRLVTEVSDREAGPSGRAARSSPVVGTWEAVIVLYVAGDLQEWVTRWRFDKDQRCAFERTTFSFVEGIRRTVERGCVFLDLGTLLEVRYDDSGATQQLPYRFPDFSNRRLILEGVEYERIG